MNCPKCGWPQVSVENRQDWADCVKTLGKQLRAAKREKREMFLVICKRCIDGARFGCWISNRKCPTVKTCPLFVKKAKVKK